MPDDNNLNLQLDQLLSGDNAQLDNLWRSSFADSSDPQAAFCSKLLAIYLGNNHFASAMSQCLQALLPAIVRSVKTDSSWLCNAEAPLQQAIVRIHQQTIGWHPNNGRGAVRFLEQFQPLIHALAHAEPMPAIDAMEQFFDREQQRLDKLEQRLHASERGALIAHRATQFSAKIINQKTTGKQLPPTMTDVIQADYRLWLQQLLLTEDANSPSVLRLSKLLETLVWTLQPGLEETEQQRLYEVIGTYCDELSAATSAAGIKGNTSSALAAIEALHLKRLRGETLDYAAFSAIGHTDPFNTQAVVSNALLKTVEHLHPGQWFLDKNDPDQARFKLSLKLSEARQLLMTNFIGVKACQFSYDEYAYQLSAKMVVKLSPGVSLIDCARSLITKLYSLHQERLLTAARGEAQRITDASEKARIQTEQQQREREQADRAQQEAQYQQRQRELEDHQRAVAAHQAEVHVQMKEASERAQKAALLVMRMSIGTWIELTGEQPARRYKLAVKLQSSGKYIFVDDTGLKKAELMSDELVAKLIEGQIRVVKEASEFEDSLAAVVNKLRENKSGRGSTHE